MIKQQPKLIVIAALGAFALACVLTLAYLWLDFGGTFPLAPAGYRVQVAFPQANELATGADVRISGVSVGKVVGLRVDQQDSRTLATLEIDHQYAPIPRDTRAELRIKTLLGETYVTLSYGSRASGNLPDDGRLPDAQVTPDVTLDQILSTFDPKTRAAFRTWVQSQAAAVNGRGQDINASFGALPGFFDSGQRLLADLNGQSSQVSGLVSGTGTFFRSISARKDQLSGLITAADSLFQTTAARNRKLAGVFKTLPAFERQSKLALPALTKFGDQSDPVIRQLEPIAGELTQTFKDTRQLAPSIRALLLKVNPTIAASKQGLPAINTILGQLTPLLASFEPFLQNANPSLGYVGDYKQEITSLIANLTAASEGRDVNVPRAPGTGLHYVRASQTLNPQSLATTSKTFGSSRDDAYRAPGAFKGLAHGLAVLDTAECQGPNPAAPTSTSTKGLAQLIQKYVYRSSSNAVAAPPCEAAGKIASFPTSFPHLTAEAPPGLRQK